MKIDLDSFTAESKSEFASNKKLKERLRKVKSKELDKKFEVIHDSAFQEIDCLECANCCKTTGSLFTSKDVERIAKHLRMKPGQFVEEYLFVDEDNDYVLQQLPCPFLAADNYCGIYEVRPKACREYPHTDRKKMVQIMELTHKNTLVCPAVFEMLERIKKAV